jgi:hypothetical protein
MIDPNTIINLDECVIRALNLFIEKGIPTLDIPQFKRPLVVGSGNAAITGRIIFEDTDAVFADESDYIKKIQAVKNIDGAIIISASGGKHAPIMAKEFKKRNIETILFTNTKNSPAEQLVEKTYVFEKNPEPYTYNTSTYLGMILGKTRENPQKILETIESIKNNIPTDLSRYTAFYIIVPNEFENIREMFWTKFDELFGPMITTRVYTAEETKHAKTLIHSNTELFIALGYENTLFGDHRLNVPLPEKFNYGTLMAIGYYVIGQIQKAKPQYFKENIEAYVQTLSEIFGEKMNVIVE